MTRFLLVAFALAASLAAVPTAQAREGCGLGWHRGPLGRCRPNEGPAVVVAPVPGAVVIEPGRRACPLGYHLGPYGHCRPND
jgi:hypothetical protein